jgi:nicotinamidase-related amidase
MNNALIVIDIQESFRQRPIWQTMSNPHLFDNANALIDAARSDGDMVVWVLHAEEGSGGLFDPVNGFVRVVDELKPLDGEPTLVKTAHNAFTTTNLGQRLAQHGVREILITGIRTEQCCETTARVGSDLGFDTTFVTDATATFASPHWSAAPHESIEDMLADPRTLSADEMVRRTEYALGGRFAKIATTAELVG